MTDPAFDTLIHPFTEEQPEPLAPSFTTPIARAALLSGMVAAAMSVALLLTCGVLAADGLSFVPTTHVAGGTADITDPTTTVWGPHTGRGKVVFWDGATVTCTARTNEKHTAVVSAFACDWKTFDLAPGEKPDGSFQKDLDIRIGIVDGKRTASANLEGSGGKFIDSYQEPHT